jgi:hypothetical protein
MEFVARTSPGAAPGEMNISDAGEVAAAPDQDRI